MVAGSIPMKNSRNGTEGISSFHPPSVFLIRREKNATSPGFIRRDLAVMLRAGHHRPPRPHPVCSNTHVAVLFFRHTAFFLVGVFFLGGIVRAL